MRGIFWALAMAGVLAACGATPGKTAGEDDPDIEEALNDRDESKADYEGCLRDQEEFEDMDCEPFKEMYEEDREAYERLLKAKKAKR